MTEDEILERLDVLYWESEIVDREINELDSELERILRDKGSITNDPDL